jgi:hypothetical protein
MVEGLASAAEVMSSVFPWTEFASRKIHFLYSQMSIPKSHFSTILSLVCQSRRLEMEITKITTVRRYFEEYGRDGRRPGRARGS